MFLFGLNTLFRTNIHNLYELTHLRLAFIAVYTQNVFARLSLVLYVNSRLDLFRLFSHNSE